LSQGVTVVTSITRIYTIFQIIGYFPAMTKVILLFSLMLLLALSASVLGFLNYYKQAYWCLWGVILILIYERGYGRD
jgi:hypothetical protein